MEFDVRSAAIDSFAQEIECLDDQNFFDVFASIAVNRGCSLNDADSTHEFCEWMETVLNEIREASENQSRVTANETIS